LTKFSKRPDSPARDRLAEALKARGEVEAKLAALTASIARLTRQIAAVGPAEAALARFDSIQAGKLAQWAQGGEADVPVADWEQRERFERELSAARATAASATSARAGLEAEYTREANKLPGAQSYASAATIEIVGESAEPLIAEAVALQSELAKKIERVVSALDVARDLMHKLAGEPRVLAGSAFTALAQKAAAVHERRPAEPSFAMRAKANWGEFIKELSTDPFALPAEA
jgi:chromosome segregation ATPase